MKKIKVRVKKELPQKVNEDVANKVYYQGQYLTHCLIEDRNRILFNIFTVRYEQNVYFLVEANKKIIECIEI